jgi:hypothetical protein
MDDRDHELGEEREPADRNSAGHGGALAENDKSSPALMNLAPQTMNRHGKDTGRERSSRQTHQARKRGRG